MTVIGRSGFWSCLSCVSLLVSGCSGNAEIDSRIDSRSSAIINGLADADDPAVVMLYDGNEAICSGTLVSPHVVLTAAHCIVKAGEGAKWTAYFGSNANAAAASDWLKITETHANPAFVFASPGAGADVGVMFLDKASSVKPVAMNRQVLNASMYNQPVRIVGFGKSEVSSERMGTKLQGTGTFDRFTDTEIHFGKAAQHECDGDSGGPALLKMDGVEKIIGVVSRHVDKECMDGYYGRLDTVVSWVDGLIKKADPTFCVDADNCAAGGGGSGGASSAGGASSGLGGSGGTQTGDRAGAGGKTGGAGGKTGGAGAGGNVSNGSGAGGASAGKPGSNSGGASAGSSSVNRNQSSTADESGCSISATRSTSKHFMVGTILALGLILRRYRKRDR
jgi:V8-like Glu-specific endopeptidase